MQKTEIQYLTHTSNPIKMRCTSISRACAENSIIHCWHLRYCDRMKSNPKFTEAVREAYAGGTPILDYDELESPEYHKKPARIGLMFMGDFLHDSIDGFCISAIWGMMKRCYWHDFFVLTKRPQRFLKLIPPLPILNNVWFGISAEDQKTYNERTKYLFQIHVDHYWISHEPGLGLINFNDGPAGQVLGKCDLCGGTDSDCPGCGGKNGIELIVCGGETGPKARPMHPDIPRHDRDQCQSASVPFFFKSWGEWEPAKTWGECVYGKAKVHCFGPPKNDPLIDANAWTEGMMVRVGHKHSGRLLDDREHNELPWEKERTEEEKYESEMRKEIAK